MAETTVEEVPVEQPTEDAEAAEDSSSTGGETKSD